MTERNAAKQPIADQMYSVLLRQLMAGEREAGSSPNIGALARELDVSQTPLREALARLEHTGLVERVALRGYRVAPMMTRGDVQQLFEARLLSEPRLAHDAALRATPSSSRSCARASRSTSGLQKPPTRRQRRCACVSRGRRSGSSGASARNS